MFTTRISAEALDYLAKYMSDTNLSTKNKAITDIIVKHNNLYLIQEKINNIEKIILKDDETYADPSKALLRILSEVVGAKEHFVNPGKMKKGKKKEGI